MKKRISKNKRKSILILLLICIFVVLILVVLIQQIKKKQEYEESLKEFQDFKEEYEDQTILPRKIYELYNYDGEYDRDVLYKSMRMFVDYLGYLKENINSIDINQFYSEKKDEILENLGIDNQEDFNLFMKNVESKNVNDEEFKYAEVEVGSSYDKSGYYNFVLYLYYGENNEQIKFNVAFAKYKSNSVQVIYQFVDE